MAAASVLSEPVVLAHAKERLFPDGEEDRSYAVCDTQFAVEEWRPGEPIPGDVRRRLAPFNAVPLGTGRPDLVGVGQVSNDLLAVERFGDDPPLVAVEAKGYTSRDTVAVGRGIRQAHDRLAEANAAYVAVPRPSVSATDRSLARELNVGVLAVSADGGVDALEVPRVVGTRTTDAATSIRFQATAQGVTDRSFPLNHPKNYLAYPIALRHDGDTETVLADRVVAAVGDARRGAVSLDLLETIPAGETLTPRGAEVVRFARRRHDSLDAALDAFETWQGTSVRFVDDAPGWGEFARRIVWAYPATTLIVEELQTMHEDGHPGPTLAEFVQWLHSQHPTFTVELFIRGTDEARSRVLDADGTLRPEALTDGAVYHAPTVFQLKAMLFHTGIPTDRGAEPSRLDPTTDEWALREPIEYWQ